MPTIDVTKIVGGETTIMPTTEKLLERSAIALVLLYATFLLSMLIPIAGIEDVQGSPLTGTRFLQSFAFAGIVLSAAYVAALAAWAALRRKWDFLVRHVAVAGATFVLATLYLNALGGVAYNQHSWNRSFANVSVVLYAVTMAIGPLARLWRPAARALAWRRETGIWGTIAAVLHLGIFWEASLGWSGWRRFFYPRLGNDATTPTLVGDRAADILPTAFNVGNAVGVIALAYAIVLTVTSNDASQRWLKRGWSWIQNRATTMWLLVLAHAWIFAYYVEGPAGPRGGTLWSSFWIVLLLQTMAFGKTVWLRGRATT